MQKIRFYPILLFLIGVVLTVAVTYSVYRNNEKIELQEFEKDCRSFESEIRIRLESNSQVLYSSASFVSSSDTVTRSEWAEFQALNKSLDKSLGAQGIGFLKIVQPEQVTDFERKLSSEGFANFKVWPEGKRPIYSAVLYLEPFNERNIQAIGYDAYSEQVRQIALDLARDSDMAVITDKITLVQDSFGNQNTAAAIMFVPVFKTGLAKSTPKERKTACTGWVFCLFRINHFIKGMSTSLNFNSLRVQIFDGHEQADQNLLFDSDIEHNILRKASARADFSIPMTFNGNTWILQFSNYHDGLKPFFVRLLPVLTLGVVISALFFVLAISLINSRAKALYIEELNQKLKKVNESKDRFISVLAHDLKSPFNSLLGFSGMLVEDIDELSYKEIKNYANQVYNAAQISHQMLDELLLWARIHSDKLPFNPVKLDLCMLCGSTIEEFKLSIDKKDITVLVEKKEEAFVYADELMVKTIFRNLIGNAIKFSHPGGQIRISGGRQNDQEVLVTVEDKGIGMSPSQVSRLFDIGSKTSREGTMGEKGTGLGLLLCKDMIDRHKGRIWAESEPGVGSKFFFSLPLYQEPS